MSVQLQLCFLLFGTCLFSFLLLLECRKLEGYDFPVFSTKKCPGNQAEWKKRSSAINCTGQNGYMCLPNENLTDLLEFCYIYPRILVQKDLCLYLDKRFSKVNSYNCRRFTHGCPELHYFSSDTYLYQSCMEIENGCFSAEPSCKRKPLRSEHSFDATTLAINLGVSIPICLLCILAFSVIGFKYGICKKRSDTVKGDEETELLLCGYESIDKNKEYSIEEVIFDQWEQEDINFISTKACKEVEKIIKSRNLVIVAGHSGSGKSAIIQHIALQYRKQDWTVKPVKKVEDIVDVYNSRGFKKNKTIFVFNNPLGKESFDEIYNDSWQRYEEDLTLFLKTAKILMSCRNQIISDSRVARYLFNRTAIVDIDNVKYKLSVDEKRHILTKYTLGMNLSDEDCNEIVKVERYFPLLCNFCSRKEKYISKGIRFFTEPVTVLKEEIIGFKEKDKGKYCALALLVLFNDDLCESDLLKNKDAEKKFKHTLKLCGLPASTPSTAIGNNLDSLRRDCFVKKIGDRYHFYHDLVMEVTTHVFGTDYPTETIKYADIGFLRKRVRLGDCEKHSDPFTIYLSDKYTEDLGERLFTELFGNRLIDVALNPCLKNKKVIQTLKRIIQKHPEKLQMLLETKKNKYKKPNYYTAKHFHLTKIAFMGLKNDLSPFYLLSNGADVNLCDEDGASPLYKACQNEHDSIVQLLLSNGADINLCDEDGASPLYIACQNGHDYTVKLLLSNGADINLCDEDEASPLYIACRNRHDSIVQLLLSNGADINLCDEDKDGASPLYIACRNRHDSIVQLLLKNGADINLFDKNGASPLYIACQNGHDSIVKLLIERATRMI
nr:uncharacterized protein LOC117689960 [Crassostrea gigas]